MRRPSAAAHVLTLASPSPVSAGAREVAQPHREGGMEGGCVPLSPPVPEAMEMELR